VPAIGRAPVRMRDTRHLPVTLTCPPVPVQGCAGILGADLDRPRTHRHVAAAYLQIYRLPAGTAGTVRLAIIKPSRVRGVHRMRATIEFDAFRGGATVAHANVTRR